MMKTLKAHGFSDQGIANWLPKDCADEISVRRLRVHNYEITPWVKQIDTHATRPLLRKSRTLRRFNSPNASADSFPVDGPVIL